MIVFSDNRGHRKSMGYKDLAKRYLEHYGYYEDEGFVVNMVLLLDIWEKESEMRFERIMPSDWNLLLKAVKVLSVDQPTIRS